MFYRVYGIKWDVDDWDIDDFNLAKRNGGIPNELRIEIDDDEDPAEVLSDYVADEVGWAVESCKYELIGADGEPLPDADEEDDDEPFEPDYDDFDLRDDD